MGSTAIYFSRISNGLTAVERPDGLSRRQGYGRLDRSLTLTLTKFFLTRGLERRELVTEPGRGGPSEA
jgi:hypothetical protein